MILNSFCIASFTRQARLTRPSQTSLALLRFVLSARLPLRRGRQKLKVGYIHPLCHLSIFSSKSLVAKAQEAEAKKQTQMAKRG